MNSSFNSSKFSVLGGLFGTFFILGSGIYAIFINNFMNIQPVFEQISFVVDYVFNLIFNSMSLLCFFVRPTTLSFACRVFSFYWIMVFEFKFVMLCIRLVIRVYETIKDLIGKSTNVISSIFIK